MAKKATTIENEVVEITTNETVKQESVQVPTQAILPTIQPVKEKMGLVETISLIADRMEAVPKNGNNTFHKYMYMKASDIIAAVNKAKRGVPFAIIPFGFEETSKAKSDTIVFGIMSFKLMAENGEFEIAQVPCSGEDKGDKIPYKCMTGALKYLYTTLFNISDVDLDDVENEKEQKVVKKQTYNNNSYQQVPQQAAPVKKPLISKEQQNTLLNLANNVDATLHSDGFIKTYNRVQECTLTTDQYDGAMKYLAALAASQIASKVEN